MMNIILLAVSVVLMYGYIAFIWWGWGVRKSISDSYYDAKSIGQGWLFVLAIWGCVIPLGVIYDTPLMWGAMTGIMLVGAARTIEGKLFTRQVHMIGAVGGITLAFISIWIETGDWLLTAAMAAMTLVLSLTAVNKFWWIEMQALLLIHFYTVSYVL